MPAHHHCALDHELRREYGVTCADYHRLLALQGGVCAVCGHPPGRWRLDLDHDHETGEVLGLIHRRHNRAVTVGLRRYVRDPPGPALGLTVDAARVDAAELRRRGKRQQARARRAAVPPARTSDGLADTIAAALRASERS
jgi:hypothetical protein